MPQLSFVFASIQKCLRFFIITENTRSILTENTKSIFNHDEKTEVSSHLHFLNSFSAYNVKQVYVRTKADKKAQCAFPLSVLALTLPYSIAYPVPYLFRIKVFAQFAAAHN